MSLGAAAASCGKRSAEPSVAPDGADELGALEQRLALREDQLRAYGVPTPAAAGRGQAGGGADAAAQTSEAQAPTRPPEPTAGVSQGPFVDEQRDTSSGGVGRCEQVCEISAAICELEQQICGLLPRHRGDDRYQAACDRAVADCKAANEACHACTPA